MSSRAKPLRPAAIVSERRKRGEGRIRAVVRAKPRLQTPDRDQHRPRHAEALLDLGERPGVPVEHGLAARDHARADMGGGEAREIVPERGDPVIVSLHGWIVGDAAERRLDHFGRDAVAYRHLLEGGKPLLESFGARAAFRGAPGRSAEDGGKCGGEGKGSQISSSYRRLRPLTLCGQKVCIACEPPLAIGLLAQKGERIS